MPSPSDATLTIFWDARVTTAGIVHKLPKKQQRHTHSPHPTAQIKPSSITETGLLVDDTQDPIAGQSYVRYPLGGGVALAGGLHY